MVVGVIDFDCDHLAGWSRQGTLKCIRFHQRFDQTSVDIFLLVISPQFPKKMFFKVILIEQSYLQEIRLSHIYSLKKRSGFVANVLAGDI